MTSFVGFSRSVSVIVFIITIQVRMSRDLFPNVNQCAHNLYIYINLVFSFAKIIIASFILNDTDTYTYYQHYYLPVSICLS